MLAYWKNGLSNVVNEEDYENNKTDTEGHEESDYSMRSDQEEVKLINKKRILEENENNTIKRYLRSSNSKIAEKLEDKNKHKMELDSYNDK